MSTTLSYTLVITGAPWASQAPQSALAVARELIQANHRIDRVFLYGEGIHLASALSTPPSDERNWPREWSELLAEHSIPAIACVASALRRGLVNDAEQARYELPASNLRAPFEIAGLGEWVEGTMKSDRVLYFHGSV
jgi:tRNA 2-thiouridine synthesizing protein D